ENSGSESDTEEPPFEKITINTDYKIKTTLEEPPTDLELKPLPDNLEYVFLEEPSFLPVIISSQLSAQNKGKLMSVLKNTKKLLPGKQLIFLESVSSHAPRVFLFGAIPAIIPVIPEVPIVPADPIVAPEEGTVSVVSPTGVLDLVDYSSSFDSDPSEDSLPPVPDLPLVSPSGSSSHDTLAPLIRSEYAIHK
ncbi:hypothetical protein Tco_1536362, partial [Tanacetum coccineum]